MFNRIGKSVLAAFVGIGTVLTLPATAPAETRLVEYEGHHQHHHHHHHHRDHDHDYDRELWDDLLAVPEYYLTHPWRHPMQYDGCTDREALNKARAYGFEHAHVVDAGRQVVVDGRRFQQKVRLIMWNEPGCPIRK